MTIFAAAMARGLAVLYSKDGESARFTSSDGYVTDCSVMVERDVSSYGEVAEINAASAVISVRKIELCDRPKRGEVFELTDTEEEFSVSQVIASDELEFRVIVA